MPVMFPEIRYLAVGDHVLLIRRRDTVACLEVQLDDTVATVECRDGIVVNTVHFDEPLCDGVVAVVDVEP